MKTRQISLTNWPFTGQEVESPLCLLGGLVSNRGKLGWILLEEKDPSSPRKIIDEM